MRKQSSPGSLVAPMIFSACRPRANPSKTHNAGYHRLSKALVHVNQAIMKVSIVHYDYYNVSCHRKCTFVLHYHSVTGVFCHNAVCTFWLGSWRLRLLGLPALGGSGLSLGSLHKGEHQEQKKAWRLNFNDDTNTFSSINIKICMQNIW